MTTFTDLGTPVSSKNDCIPLAFANGLEWRKWGKKEPNLYRFKKAPLGWILYFLGKFYSFFYTPKWAREYLKRRK